MAGQDWNVAKPIDHLKVSLIPQKIRDLRSATKTIIQVEHVDLGAGVGGQHLKGSARVYMSDAMPTLDPESENLATSATSDDGRLAVATGIGTNTMRVYIATSGGISTGWKGIMVANAGTAARLDLANEAYAIGRNYADDGDVNMIKINADDVPEVLVGAVLSADTDPATSAGIAPKKYVDDKVATGVYARLYRGTNQAIGTNTWTKVELASESFDSASIGNTGTYRITPDAAGYYQVNAMVGWTEGATDKYFRGEVRKNGSVIMIHVGQDYGNNPQSDPMSDIVYFNGSTDYIELWGLTDDAGQDVKGGSEYTYLSVCKMPS